MREQVLSMGPSVHCMNFKQNKHKITNYLINMSMRTYYYPNKNIIQR